MNLLPFTALACVLIFCALNSTNAKSPKVRPVWGNWGDWSDCSVSCGGGKATRERRCTNIVGDETPRCLRKRQKKCNLKPCPKEPPVMSEPIPTLPDDESPAPTPESSNIMTTTEDKYKVMTQWGPWSMCEKKCGGGMRYRARECVKANGKPDCEDVEGQKCNTFPCAEPKPFGESGPEWESPVVEHSSEAEPTPSPEVEPPPFGRYGPDEEPPPFGEFGPEWDKSEVMAPWGPWSMCEKKCGGGMQYRTRECVKANGKPECEDVLGRKCNMHLCSEPTSSPEPTLTLPYEEPGPEVEPLPSVEYGPEWEPAPEPEVEPPPFGRYGPEVEPPPFVYVGSPFAEPIAYPEPAPETTVHMSVGNESVPEPTATPSIIKGKQMKILCGGNKVQSASKYAENIAISPGYPAGFPSSLDCMWVVKAPKGYRVKITVDQFYSDECCDSLTLLEGRPYELPYKEARIATLKGDVPAGTVYFSVGRIMTLRLKTGEDSDGGGYRLRYVATEFDYEEYDYPSNPDMSDFDDGYDDTSPMTELWWRLYSIITRLFLRGTDGEFPRRA